MIRVRVPATSANIGPGFDCLGIALSLYNNFEVEEIEEGLEIDGCAVEFRNENNLVVKAMKRCYEKIGYKSKGIRLKMQCELPIARGLGSSAACILGGVAAANEIAGSVLDRDELLETAVEIEGHPDNLAPAFYGGMTVSIKSDEKVYAEKLRLSDELRFCAMIPDFTLSTEVSRGVLPQKVPYKDAVFNLGRIGLLITAFGNGDADMMRIGCEDRLHERYRSGLIRDYNDIKLMCRKLNAWGVFLSGAGPTIMAVIHKNDKEFARKIGSYLTELEGKWTVKQLEPDHLGILIENEKQKG